MTDVFISYSRKDKDFVKALHGALVEHSREAWVDWQDIPLTADWWQEIERGIEAANTFIFVISPDSIASKVCNQEIDHAVQHHKRLIPVVRRDDLEMNLVHPALAKHNWLFFRERDDFDRTFQQLLEAIDTDLEHVKQHTRILVRAIEWENKNHNPDLLLRGSELEAVIQWLTQNAEKEPRSTQIQRDYISESRQAESDRQEAEIQQQRIQIKRQRMWLGAVAMVSVVAIAAAFFAFNQYQQAEQRRIEAEKSEVMALTASSEALFSLNKRLDALMQALKAGQLVNHASWQDHDIRIKAIAALQQAVYGVQERNRLEGHTSRLQGVAFSPDGQQIASVSQDHTAILWGRDGRLIKRLTGHTNFVDSLTFNPKGDILATVSSDKTCKLWNQKGELLHTLKNSSGINAIAFSPDGKQIATGNDNKTVTIWDLEGNLLNTIQGFTNYLTSVAFSPDGQILATSERDINTVKLWSQDGALIQTLKHPSGINDVKFSPDGSKIATASQDGTIRVWNRSGQLLTTIEVATPTYEEFSGIGVRTDWDGETKSLKIVEVFQNAPAMEAGLKVDDRIIAIDGIATNQMTQGSSIKQLRGAVGTKVSVKIARSGEKDFVLSLKRARFRSPSSGSDAVMSLAFNHNGKTIASANYDGTVKLWNLDGSLAKTFLGHSGLVYSVSFSPNGQELASAGFDNSVRLWKVNNSELPTMRTSSGSSPGISFSPDGEMIAAVDYEDGAIYLWNRKGKLIKRLFRYQGLRGSVSFSPDGQVLAASNTSNEKAISLWSRDGVLLKTLKGHTDDIFEVTFSPDSQTIASASADKTIRLWNRNGALLRTLAGHTDQIYSVSFSPDGQTIASASLDRTIKLWNRNGTLLKTLKGHSDQVYGVRFSPDGQMIASASNDTTIKLWSRDGELLKTLQGHTRGVFSVSFNQDGTLVASSGGKDGTVKLWNRDGTELASFQSPNAVLGIVALSPDSKAVAVGSFDKGVILWNLDLQALVKKGCDWVRDYVQTNPNLEERDRRICN